MAIGCNEFQRGLHRRKCLLSASLFGLAGGLGIGGGFVDQLLKASPTGKGKVRAKV